MIIVLPFLRRRRFPPNLHYHHMIKFHHCNFLRKYPATFSLPLLMNNLYLIYPLFIFPLRVVFIYTIFNTHSVFGGQFRCAVWGHELIYPKRAFPMLTEKPSISPSLFSIIFPLQNQKTPVFSPSSFSLYLFLSSDH